MDDNSSGKESEFTSPKLWSIEELQGAHEPEFKEKILHEKLFSVYFSNQGSDRKEDPLYNKRREKGSQKKRPCTAIMKGGSKCEEEHQSPFGVCATHKKDVLEKHTVDWVGYFIPPPDLLSHLDKQTRKRIQKGERLLIPMHGWLIERLLLWSKSDENKREMVNEFMKKIAKTIPGKVPDATSLQETLVSKRIDCKTPDNLVALTKRTVEEIFPFAEFLDECVSQCVFSNKPRKNDSNNNELSPVSIEIPQLPVRIVASLIFLAMIAEEANRGDSWFRCIHNLGEPERAGAHFAYTIYILRKENRMSIKQISKLLQVPPWE